MISTLIRFRSFMRAFWLPLGVGAVCTLVATLFALAHPWPLKVVVDSVLQSKPVGIPGAEWLEGRSKETVLLAAAVSYVAIVSLAGLFDYLGTLLMDSSGQRMVVAVREALFARLQRLSLRFHSSQRAGDLISRIMSDIDRMHNMLVQSFSILVPNVALLVGMLVVMLRIDWSFTLIALAVSPLLFVAVFRYTNRIKTVSRLARRKEGALAAHAGEVLGAIPVVQAFTREDHEDERFSQQSAGTMAANLEVIRLQARFSPLVDILAGAGTALVLYVGTKRVLSGDLELGVMLVFLSYLSSLYKPMRQLSKLAYVTSKGTASAERVSEILDAQIDVEDPPDGRAAPHLSGKVQFMDVEFAYGEKPVLLNISLTAEPGEIVGLVGPTGAGKSSLVSLIPRFFDVRRGCILLDGIDVRSMRLQSLRSQIAIVLQEPILFEGTILENIGYGQPSASEEEILAAARAALVDDFVTRLPEGYATRVGERGATLSGGERQRISIARALVRDAPILILDEPTSGLDPRSEVAVMKALHNLMSGRTTFVIAHRMSTISGADQVVVLDQGRIVERGTHAELMQVAGGLYRTFLDLQMKGAEPEPEVASTPFGSGGGLVAASKDRGSGAGDGLGRWNERQGSGRGHTSPENRHTNDPPPTPTDDHTPHHSEEVGPEDSIDRSPPTSEATEHAVGTDDGREPFRRSRSSKRGRRGGGRHRMKDRFGLSRARDRQSDNGTDL
jgi:ATP-binding cassette subfamily B protein